MTKRFVKPPLLIRCSAMAAAEDAPYLCYKELLPPSSFRVCSFSKLKVAQQTSKVDFKTPNTRQ